MSIVCTGSIAYDYLMTFPGYFRDHILPDHLDSISLSFLVDSMARQRGGTAPNIAYSLALLGEERPLLMGTVGEDFEEYRLWLEEMGIDTTFTRVIPGEYTASFFANTDRANNQIASFYSGAMAHASSLTLHDVLPRNPELVVISPNDPKAMARLVDECRELGVPYLYDPSQQLARVDAEEIRQGVAGAQSLFLNDYEYQLLQKHTGLKPGQILETVDFMVITLGAQGACVYAGGREHCIASVPPERILDPTGVGDAFRGGFLRGYRLGLDWQTCGQMGALAATYCLEQRSPQGQAYTPQEYITRYRLHYDDQGMLDVLLQ